MLKLQARYAVLVVALALSSIYALPSGMPQIADLFLVVFVAIFAVRSLRYGILLPDRRFIVWWGLLVLWIGFVSLMWVMIQADANMARPVLYHVFNYCVGLALLGEASRNPNLLRYIRAGICLGLVVSLIGVVLNLGAASRGAGFFNNPNQLAYYSLSCIATLLVIDGCRVRIDALSALAYAGAVVGILAAASIAAILGAGLLLVVIAITQLRSGRRLGRLILIVLLAGSSAVALDAVTGRHLSDGLVERYERSGEKMDGAYEERGFDRIVENPEYLIFGAGEGGFERFPAAGGRELLELHSSILTLLFSYGVFGLAMFCMVLKQSLKSAPLPYWLIMGSVMIYHITHMGLRFTSFWVFVVVLSIICRQAKHGESAPKSECGALVSRA